MSFKSILHSTVKFALWWIVVGASPLAAATHIAAIMPGGANFKSVLSGIQSELGPKYVVQVFDAEKMGDVKSVADKIRGAHTDGLILMDSKAVSIYHKMVKIDSTFSATPKFIVMTLQLDDVAQMIPHTAGIRFEVPGFTLFTRFRNLSQQPVSIVGVFYRKIFSRMVQENKRLLAKENIMVIDQCIDCDQPESITAEQALTEVEKRFDTLLEHKVQALWLLPDNIYLNQHTLKKFWIDRVRAGRIPVVAPIDNLAGEKLNVAIFSAHPDYSQLGVDAAGQITRVFEDGNNVDSIGIESLISIKTVANLKVAAVLDWKLKAEQLAKVNKVVPK